MRVNSISYFLLLLMSLLVIQSIGGYFQIRDYRRAVHRSHKLGNIGIGQKRGRFLDGHVVIIACDGAGTITGAEILDGISVWARFHPLTSFAGKELKGYSIYEFLEMTEQFTKKQLHQYRGYVRALEALEVRLTGRELTRERFESMRETAAGAGRSQSRRLRNATPFCASLPEASIRSRISLPSSPAPRLSTDSPRRCLPSRL